MIDVLPLSITGVNWQLFNGLEFNPIKRLDADRISLKTPAAFILAVGFLEYSKDVKSAELLRNQPDLLAHVSMGFLLKAPRQIILEFARKANGCVIHGNLETQAITANMKVWKDVVVRCCKTSERFEIRLIANKIYEYADQAGFRDIWHLYTKNSLKDGSFELCRLTQ